jgi:hypothetical protein
VASSIPRVESCAQVARSIFACCHCRSTKDDAVWETLFRWRATRSPSELLDPASAERRLGERDMSRGPCRSQPNCIAALIYITAVQRDLTLPSVAQQCLALSPNSDQHVLLTIDTLVPLGRAPQPLPDRIVPRVHSAGSSGECRSDLSNLESSTLKCLSLFAERQRSNLQSPRAECHLYIQMGEFEQRDVVHQVRPVCPGGVDHAWNLV